MSEGWLTRVSVVAAAVGLAAAAWQTHRFSKLENAARSLAGETESIRGRAERAEIENARLRALAGIPSTAPAPLVSPPGVRRATPAPADLEPARLAIQLRENLREANSTIAELEMRIGTLEEKLRTTATENQRLSAEEQDLRERVDSTVRLVGAVQAELKSRDQRLLQLELANKNLRDSGASASERAARAAQAIREVEEIGRRRETYLADILRRFRDLTDQYRAIALRLDNPGDLSRIQTAVSMAEEDFKQITSLNAQAARAQAKINK
jgi:regulator of replication initiation timing